MTAAGSQPPPLEPAAEGEGATVLDTVLATTEQAPAEARAAVGKLLEAVDPSSGIADDSLLLVSELVTNTVRHAVEGPEGRVRVRVELSRSAPVGAPIWSSMTVRRSRSAASRSMVLAKLPPRAA